MQKRYFLGLALVLVGVAVALFIFPPDRPKSSLDIQRPVPTEASGMNPEASGSAFLEPSPLVDCANECVDLKNDAESYAYCRTVCGFTTEDGIELTTPPDSPRSTDYELRDAAIRERDIEKCSAIRDANLRTMCQARVTEDLLE